MDKREFIKLAGLAGVAALSNPSGILAADAPAAGLMGARAPFELPALPYAFNALEPNIDKTTMEIHHDKHHGAYVKNLNDAVNGTPFASLKLEEILGKVTERDKAIRNNGGGHYNHSLFWQLLSPQKTTPSEKVTAAVKSAFGTWEGFQQKFSDAAKGVFGSGWAWLIVTPEKKLSVISSPNQDNPLMHGLVKERGIPVLGLDVWEHSYYLKYQNRRPEYIAAFWNVVNWPEVEKLYTAAMK